MPRFRSKKPEVGAFNPGSFRPFSADAAICFAVKTFNCDGRLYQAGRAYSRHDPVVGEYPTLFSIRRKEVT